MYKNVHSSITHNSQTKGYILMYSYNVEISELQLHGTTYVNLILESSLVKYKNIHTI